jgi:hypothetical protein
VHPRLRLVAIVGALAGCIPRSSAPLPAADLPPAELLGRFRDDYENAFNVSRETWEQLPHGRYHIVEWHSDLHFLVAQNDFMNPGDPGLWTRIDWIALNGMAPYAWAFCMTTYNAPARDVARATAPANGATPRTGCNSYPFSRMRPDTGR